MGRPITEEELVQKEATHDQRWQAAVDVYLEGFPNTELECQKVNQLLCASSAHVPALVFAAAMARLHLTIGRQKGELLGPIDLIEGENHV